MENGLATPLGPWSQLHQSLNSVKLCVKYPYLGYKFNMHTLFLILSGFFSVIGNRILQARFVPLL